MGLFSNKSKERVETKEERVETKEERINRIIREEAGKHFMFLFEYSIDTEDLDLFYEKGWEFISFGGHLCSSHYFKKRPT